MWQRICKWWAMRRMDPLTQIIHSQSPRRIKQLIRQTRDKIQDQVVDVFDEALKDPKFIQDLVDASDKYTIRESLQTLVRRSKVIITQPLKTNLEVKKPKRW